MEAGVVFVANRSVEVEQVFYDGLKKCEASFAKK
jgi:hypothetical protein